MGDRTGGIVARPTVWSKPEVYRLRRSNAGGRVENRFLRRSPPAAVFHVEQQALAIRHRDNLDAPGLRPSICWYHPTPD